MYYVEYSRIVDGKLVIPSVGIFESGVDSNDSVRQREHWKSPYFARRISKREFKAHVANGVRTHYSPISNKLYTQDNSTFFICD